MKLQVPIFKSFFSVFIIFFVWQTSLLAGDVQEITNMVEVLKAIKNVPNLAQLSKNTGGTSGNISGTSGNTGGTSGNTGGTSEAVVQSGLVSQSPAVWSQPSVALCSAPFQVTPNALTGAMYSGQASQAMNCQSGLQFINVGLTDSNGQNYLAFTFNTTGRRLQVLAQEGLYIAINMSTLNGVNSAQVALTNQQGTIVSQITFQLPANVGFMYANIGFNMTDTLVIPGGNQTYVNWVPINNQQRVYYLQNSGMPTTSPIGGQIIPNSQGNVQVNPVVAKQAAPLSQVLTPPTSPIAASQLFGNSWGTAPTDSFIVTGNVLPKNMKVIVDRRQGGTALACQGGLQFINVGLIGAGITGGWACEFNIAASPVLQQLAQQGLYVVVTTYQVSAQNIASVSLTDISGNIFAQTSLTLPAGQGFSWINIGYNKNDTFSPLKADQVYVNWLPLTANSLVASWYQDQGVATMVSTKSVGGRIAPRTQMQQGTAPQVNKQQGNAQKVNTPPAIPITPFVLAAKNIDNTCAFQAPGLMNFTPTAADTLSSIPFSCQGGLNTINIGLSDTGGCFASFNFDATILNQPSIQTLMKNGMYIGVSTIASSNTIVAVLMDQNNNVYAQGTIQLPANTGGQIGSWNLGLNTTDSNVVDGVTKLGYNGIGLPNTVLYQQLATVSQPLGAVMPSDMYGLGGL